MLPLYILGVAGVVIAIMVFSDGVSTSTYTPSVTSSTAGLNSSSTLKDWIHASEADKISFCKTINLGGVTDWHTWYDFLEASKIFYPNENGTLLSYCRMMAKAAEISNQ